MPSVHNPIVLVATTVAGLWLALSLAVVLRKRRRDLRERRSSARRSECRGAFESVDPGPQDRILLEAAASISAQSDLLAALDFPPALDFSPVEYPGVAAATLSDAMRAQGRSGDPVRRGLAALLASRLKLSCGLDLALSMLDDPDPDVRLAACRALANIGSSESARGLIDAVGRVEVPAPRLIERLCQPWAADELLVALRYETDPQRRVAVIRALGLIGERRAVDRLAESIRSAEPEERINATRALSQIGGARALEPLRAALADPEWAVRAQAARGLGGLGNPIAAPDLASHLTDRAWWVRANASNALAELGEPGLGALREIAERSPDRYARDRAQETLAMVGVRIAGTA